MPNILKHFRKPSVTSYIFPDAEELEVEPDKPAAPEEEPPREASPPGQEAPEPEETAPGPKQTLQFAAVQAEKILEDARRQAEELAVDRLRQAQQEIDAAREEAKTEGYRQGYQEGLAQARLESQRRTEEQLQRMGKEVAAFLEKASLEKEELVRQAQDELCDLCIAVAEKVIHISLKSSREVIARMIQVVTEKMKRRQWVHIYVGGCDAGGLAQITPELTVALASLSDHIKIIPMADDESGTCIIEMPDEIIDASVSTQIQNIKELLKDS